MCQSAGLCATLVGVDADSSDTAARRRVLQHLRDLIEALDRRVPHVERAGEVTIAREASDLRATAMQRVAELEDEERAATNPAPPSQERLTGRRRSSE